MEEEEEEEEEVLLAGALVEETVDWGGMRRGSGTAATRLEMSLSVRNSCDTRIGWSGGWLPRGGTPTPTRCCGASDFAFFAASMALVQ